MNLLLDTHTILWFWWDDPRLSDTAKAVIVDPDNRKLVSTASCWEVAIKVGLKKLDLGAPFRGFIPQQMLRNNLESLSITDDHLAAFVTLPFHHRDPFDRLLIAQATWDDLPVVSADEQLDAYGIERLW
jgi:PIN domain nuclease of toxin-antitoxin system